MDLQMHDKAYQKPSYEKGSTLMMTFDAKFCSQTFVLSLCSSHVQLLDLRDNSISLFLLFLVSLLTTKAIVNLCIDWLSTYIHRWLIL